MKALLFDGKALHLTLNHPKPAPHNNEALIKVLLAGICNTDVEITRGYMGFTGVPGHEFVGIVKEAPQNKAALIGRRVVGEINIGCGVCPLCQIGGKNHCPNRTVLGILNKDGAFSEYLTLPVENLHVISDSITDEEAVFVEPLAAAMRIPEQVHIKPSDRVLVLGDGKLGLLIAMVLSRLSPALTLVGRHPEKLSIVKNEGISTSVHSSLDPKIKYDIVVDATGSASGFNTALSMLMPEGVLVLKSTVASSAAPDMALPVINEITIIGSRCGPFGPAIKALEDKSISVNGLVTEVFMFSQAIEAFETAQSKNSVKVLLNMKAVE